MAAGVGLLRRNTSKLAIAHHHEAVHHDRRTEDDRLGVVADLRVLHVYSVRRGRGPRMRPSNVPAYTLSRSRMTDSM